jgi:hypothetical protein
MSDVKNVYKAMLTGVVFFASLVLCRAEPPVEKTEKTEAIEEEEDKYTIEEKRWAVQWINERLALLMEDGLIKLIKCYKDDENYEVFVSSSWDFLTAEEKRLFLRDLSRAREITQHSPYLAVRNNDTGEVVAQVNKWGILIFDATGEYFFPLNHQDKDVLYDLPD